jgi:hypothetical protein
LGQDQYPQNLIDAHNVLSNYQFNAAYAENNKKKQEKECQPTATSSLQLEQNDVPQLSCAQMEGLCYCCVKKGLRSPFCRHKNKPKEEWTINKTPELIQAQNVMSEQSQAQNDNAEKSITTTPL